MVPRVKLEPTKATDRTNSMLYSDKSFRHDYLMPLERYKFKNLLQQEAHNAVIMKGVSEPHIRCDPNFCYNKKWEVTFQAKKLTVSTALNIN